MDVRSIMISAVVLCSCGAQSQPAASGEVCVTAGSEQICCAPGRAVTPTVVSSAEACTGDELCPIVPAADFATHDVIVATPNALGVRFELQGPPTTLGTEWRIYRQLEMSCKAPGAAGFTLRAGADAGGGTVVYWAAVPKLGGATVQCHCARAAAR